MLQSIKWEAQRVKTIAMYLKRRENNYTRGGFEWVLMGKVDDSYSDWCMKSYGFNKPTPAQVRADTDLVTRTTEVLFKNYKLYLTVPEITLEGESQ